MGITVKKRKREFTNTNNLSRKKNKREEDKNKYTFCLVSQYFLDLISKERLNSKVILKRDDIFLNLKIETQRNGLFNKLRVIYRDLCHDYFDILDPKESFNRWIMERHTMFPYGRPPNECDPLIPFSVEPIPPPSLLREILEDIPCKIPFATNSKQLKENIQMYIDATLKLLDPSSRFSKNNKEIDSEKRLDCVKRCKKEMENMSEIESISDMTELRKHMERLRNYCDPYLHQRFKPSVELLCEKMVNLADEYANDLIKMKNLLKIDYDHSLNIQTKVNIKKYSTYVMVSYNDDKFFLNINVYNKLKSLYEMANENVIKDELNFSIWCLHYRYRTLLGGLRKFEGSGLQAAVPRETFSKMHELFDVSMECFASPFNCYFSNYCSVFNDIDILFNSSGSFFHFHPTEGSFEANPPFCDEVIDAMRKHMENLLDNAKEKPLSFIIYLPHWENPPSIPIENLKKSKYLRKWFILNPDEHRYLNGFQQDSKPTHKFIPVHSSIVLFLQNDLGYEKWNPTEEKVKILRDSFLSNDTIN